MESTTTTNQCLLDWSNEVICERK